MDKKEDQPRPAPFRFVNSMEEPYDSVRRYANAVTFQYGQHQILLRFENFKTEAELIGAAEQWLSQELDEKWKDQTKEKEKRLRADVLGPYVHIIAISFRVLESDNGVWSIALVCGR